jgi:hypothetical protein
MSFEGRKKGKPLPRRLITLPPTHPPDFDIGNNFPLLQRPTFSLSLLSFLGISPHAMSTGEKK